MITRDRLWKGIIEDAFPDFLRFFYHEYVDEIDFEKGFEFLDQEFFKLFPEAKDTQNRRVDKLAKVYTKIGGVRWILIHIEVQGYEDKYFSQRMFEYYYRILEAHQKPLTALAIFTESAATFHPKEHRISFWGTEMIYRFNTYKLLEKTPADFKQKDNPFSILMETAWYGLKQNKLDDEHLCELKLRLMKQLIKFGHSRARISNLFCFLELYVDFESSAIKRKFEKELDIILKKSKYMGIKYEIEQFYKEKAKEKIIGNSKRIAQNMQKKGFSETQIAEILEISSEEIQRLLASDQDKV